MEGYFEENWRDEAKGSFIGTIRKKLIETDQTMMRELRKGSARNKEKLEDLKAFKKRLKRELKNC